MSTPSRGMTCPSCSAQVSAESRFCSTCGEAIQSLSQMPTAGTPNAPAPKAAAGRVISSSSVPVGGFTPGTILVERYRIVGLAGRGGMGEVYRADDLKLGQAVALKFLPRALSNDPVRRERFFAEVRITRQLSHPNICRVYDIAEFDGQHFLSMEFIDGEDLASLIRRIGYLTNEKALDIARQLAAGLSAAHEKGVLHRDLKPANIMIDGHGRVRITDFGIAIAIDDEAQAAEISGTPAYMAPEQLAGKGATVRSDIYSLGLILYELCCGKRAFTAATLAEIREQKEGYTPRAPSDIRTGVDPILERLVTRCIERDPRARPASVAQLASALPGGDPLAAAIAAGETPSPEMVAASGLKEGLRPAVGLALLAFFILGLFGIVALNKVSWVFYRVPAGKPPELLAERAREILKKFGYTDLPADSAPGYDYAFSPFTVAPAAGADWERSHWLQLEPYSLRFWYRESPEPLQHGADNVNIAPGDPPMLVPGEARVQLDTEGRLREFTALPKAAVSTGTPNPQAVWSLLFSEAGLDPSEFRVSGAPWKPSFYADAVAAWEGTLSRAPDIPLRIEAAAYGGKPVEFRMMLNAAGHTLIVDSGSTVDSGGLGLAFRVIELLTVIGALFFVRRNVHLGRGDRRGAAKLAGFCLATATVGWIVREHHIASTGEVRLFLSFAGDTALLAGVVWLFYMALEPILRRRWPETLISWTRLLNGEWRDPLVGRDVLIGCTAAVLGSSFSRFNAFAAGTPLITDFGGIFGTNLFVAWLVEGLGGPLIFSLGLMIAFFLLKRILRQDWLVAGLLGLVIGFFAILAIRSWLSLGAPLLIFLFLFLCVRFGLLVLTVGIYVMEKLDFIPMTFDTSAWYFRTGLAAILFMLVLSIAAFRISLGGAHLLKELED